MEISKAIFTPIVQHSFWRAIPHLFSNVLSFFCSFYHASIFAFFQAFLLPFYVASLQTLIPACFLAVFLTLYVALFFAHPSQLDLKWILVLRNQYQTIQNARAHRLFSSFTGCVDWNFVQIFIAKFSSHRWGKSPCCQWGSLQKLVCQYWIGSQNVVAADYFWGARPVFLET